MTALERVGRRAVLAATVVGLLVTGFGVTFLVERTHRIGDWSAAIADRPEDVLISRSPYAFRDAGARYTLESRWLLAADDAAVPDAFAVAGEAGATSVGLIADRGTPASTVPGWCAGSRTLVPWDGSSAVVTHYDRAAADGTCAPAPAADPPRASTSGGG